jgi:hypothetical protein
MIKKLLRDYTLLDTKTSLTYIALNKKGILITSPNGHSGKKDGILPSLSTSKTNIKELSLWL